MLSTGLLGTGTFMLGDQQEQLQHSVAPFRLVCGGQHVLITNGRCLHAHHWQRKTPFSLYFWALHSSKPLCRHACKAYCAHHTMAIKLNVHSTKSMPSLRNVMIHPQCTTLDRKHKSESEGNNWLSNLHVTGAFIAICRRRFNLTARAHVQRLVDVEVAVKAIELLTSSAPV
jgi:hypothetical protein